MAPNGCRYSVNRRIGNLCEFTRFVYSWCAKLVVLVCVATNFGAQQMAQGADPFLVYAGTVESTFGQLRGFADRRKAEDLLQRARHAIEDGKLELAQWYVDRAENLNVNFDTFLRRMSDTPAKIRDDIRKARVNLETLPTLQNNTQSQPRDKSSSVAPSQQFTPQTTTLPPVDGTATPPAFDSNVSPDRQLDVTAITPKSRALDSLHRARNAVQLGNRVAAVNWYQRVLATGARFSPDEYGPQQLADELRKLGVEEALLAPPAPAASPTSLGSTDGLLDPAAFFGKEPQIPALLEESALTPLSRSNASLPDPATEAAQLNFPVRNLPIDG